MKRIFSIILAVLAIAGCEEEPSSKGYTPDYIFVDKTDLTMIVGENVTLKARVVPSTTAQPQFTWISSDSSVAEVSAGTITAISEGKCVVTVSALGKKTDIKVSVELPSDPQPSAEYSLAEDNALIYARESYRIPILIELDGNKTEYDIASNPNGLIFSSENDSVAEVSMNGEITGKETGTATIRISRANGTDILSFNIEILPARTIPEGSDKMEFAINAWYSLTPDLVTHERFLELEECGFTLSTGVSNWDYSYFMQASLDAASNTKVKCLLLTTGMDELIRTFMNHPQLAGYNIKDEPPIGEFKSLAQRADRIKSIDRKHLVYINLYPIYANESQLGTASYSDYLDQFMNTVKPEFLSYDHYPIQRTGEIRSDYYKNFEMAFKAAERDNVPLWPFVCSVNTASNKRNSLTNMRLEAFSSLAYGAQAIQYFTYVTPSEGDYCDAPLDTEGNKTEAWTSAKTINSRIQKSAWVFNGAKVVAVRHAGSIPEGTTKFDDSVLPFPITKLETGAGNFLISHLRNGNMEFLVIVNTSNKSSQSVTISHKAPLMKIDDNGLRTTCGDTVEILPGDMLVLQTK